MLPEPSAQELRATGEAVTADQLFPNTKGKRTLRVITGEGPLGSIVTRLAEPIHGVPMDGAADWTVTTCPQSPNSQIPGSGEAQDAHGAISRRLTLRRQIDGSVALVRLDDPERRTRTMFDGPLVLMPGTLWAGEPFESQSTARVDSLDGSGGRLDSGPVRNRITLLSASDAGGSRRVLQSMTIELSHSTVRRQVTQWLDAASVPVRELEILTVNIGPLRIVSRRQELELIASEPAR